MSTVEGQDNPKPEAEAPKEVEKSLEQLTNETFADSYPPQKQEALGLTPSSEEEPKPETEAPTQSSEAGGQADQQFALSDEEKSLMQEIRAVKEMTGTSFKSPADLIKGYKELQGQFTKDRDFVSKAKPHEQLLNDMNDPQLANFLQQAVMLYRNPQLASAYVGQNGNLNSPPDPRSYNMYDDADLAKYQKDLSDYNSRQVDSRINARLGNIEQTAQLEKMKLELKQVFPESEPDKVMDFISKRGGKWSLADAYKIMNFDEMKVRSLEEARKELSSKLETAAKTTTPKAQASAKDSVKVEDIVNHIARYGGDSARKKYGDKAYVQAMKDMSQFA